MQPLQEFGDNTRMSSAPLTHRLAHHADIGALTELMDVAIAELQKPFLNEKQIASSSVTMGLDTQLIDDRIYFIAEIDGELAGRALVIPS